MIARGLPAQSQSRSVIMDTLQDQESLCSRFMTFALLYEPIPSVKFVSITVWYHLQLLLMPSDYIAFPFPPCIVKSKTPSPFHTQNIYKSRVD